ncbi:protein phosphatase 1G [Tachypleus tridentatus]|uniref:protein phosphatase 1G n=1 Tax=Tachypleus tridentatus TaxID=6853 RepID=UPI003FD491E9
MGAYLSEPVTEKISTNETSPRLSYGASSMQGWRVSQEDAHNCIINYDENTSFFAVYDGHGGAEVAKYCSMHFPEYLRSVPEYSNGNIAHALEDAFLKFDATLTEPEVVSELKHIAGVSDASDSEPDDTEALHEEAVMPLEDLLARYKSLPLRLTPQIKRISHDKPRSPMLRAKKSSSDEDDDLQDNSVDQEELECNSKDTSSTETENRVSSSDGEGEKKVNKTDVDLKNKLFNGEDKVGSSECDSIGESSKKANMVDIGTSNEAQSKCNGPSSSVDELDTKEPGNSTSKKSYSEKDWTSELKVNKTDDCGDNEVTCSSSTNSIGNGSVGSSSNGDTKLNLTDLEDEGSSCTTTNNEAGRSGCDSSVGKSQHLSSEEPESSDDDEEDEEYMESESEDSVDENEDGSDEQDDDEEGGECNEDQTNPEITLTDKEQPGTDSGCTAVVSVIKGKEMYIANAGDSRCVVCRNGKAIDLSFDHKPEDEPERNRIERAGGHVTPDGRVNGGLNLSRAIGDHAYKQVTNLSPKEQMITALPDIQTLTIDPDQDEFMVLACDGIWNFMSSQEVVDFIKERLEPEKQLSKICEELFDHCLAPDTMGDGTGCDNMTCIIVNFHSLISSMPSCNKRKATQNEDLEEDAEQKTKKVKVDVSS